MPLIMLFAAEGTTFVSAWYHDAGQRAAAPLGVTCTGTRTLANNRHEAQMKINSIELINLNKNNIGFNSC